MTDQELRSRVRTALDYACGLDASEIGVVVERGIARLRGPVGSQAAKATAERVALRVRGIRGVVNALAVRILSGRKRRDADIEHAAAIALRRIPIVPSDQISVTVRGGRLMLDGTVAAQYQKDAAERTVRELSGIRLVQNRINVSSPQRSMPLDTTRRSG